MFVHSVYFWLKPDLSEKDLADFKDGLSSLTTIEACHAGYFGTPAATDRPIIDRSYDFGLTMIYNDKAQHDEYQTHPVHVAFVEKCSHMWDRVLIYDAD